MNYVGGYKKPFRPLCGEHDFIKSMSLKCGCAPFQNALQNLRQVSKNTTAITGAAVDGTTGKSTIDHLVGHGAGDVCNQAPPGDYNGSNYGTAAGGPWVNPFVSSSGVESVPANTYSLTSCVATMTVADGGSGFAPGDTFDISGGSVESPGAAASGKVLTVDGTGKALTVGIVLDMVCPGGLYSANPPSPNTVTVTGGTGTGLTVSLTFGVGVFDSGYKCAQVGVKSLWAARQWHGRFGFLSHDTGGGFADVLCPSAPAYNYESYQPSPDQIKYTVLTLASHYHFESTYRTFGGAGEVDDNYYSDAVLNRVISIDPQTGKKTQNGTGSAESYYIETGPGTGPVKTALSSMLDNDHGDGPYYVSLVTILDKFYGSPLDFPTADALKTLVCPGFEAYITEFTYTITNTEILIHLVMHYVSVPPDYDPGTVDITLDISMTLSGENKASDIVTDLLALQAVWDLDDDVLFPYAAGTYSGVCPLVTRNEKPGHFSDLSFYFFEYPADADGVYVVNLDVNDFSSQLTGSGTTADPYATWNKRDWFDDTFYDWQFPLPISTDGAGEHYNIATGLVARYDGAILGAPNTAGGDYPQDYFDFRFEHYILDSGCGGDGLVRDYYGGNRSAAGGDLPPRATQWTNLKQAAGAVIGKNLIYGALQTGFAGIAMSDYRVTPIILPSADNSRPWGADRSLMDEENIASLDAATGFDGSTAKVDTLIGTINPGDKFYFWNTGHDGLYNVDSYSGGMIGVTFLSALPPGFTYWDDGVGVSSSGLCARARFPYCPPFAGKIKITSVTDNDGGTVTVETEAVAMPFDTPKSDASLFNLTLCSTAETGAEITLTALASNLTPSSATGTASFIVTADFATVKNADCVVLYGALPADTRVPGVKNWYWRDTTPKNDYVEISWTRDQRTNGEATRLHGKVQCDGSTPISYTGLPTTDGAGNFFNADGSPNYGYSANAFPGKCKSFVPTMPKPIIPSGGFAGILDERYGSAEWIMLEQAMVEPLYQTPHSPVFGSGSRPACVPYCEARATLPMGGLSGTEVAPAEIDYTLKSAVDYPATTPFVETPPTAGINSMGVFDGTQPIESLITTGIEEGC